MAFGNLYPANFHAQLAPTNTHGRGLVPVQQAAHAIVQEWKDERRKDRVGLIGNGHFMGDWEERHRLVNSIEKRMERGGSTMRPQDALVNSPRGKYPVSLKEMDL